MKQNKLFSLLIVAFLVLSMIPSVVFAIEGEEQDIEFTTGNEASLVPDEEKSNSGDEQAATLTSVKAEDGYQLIGENLEAKLVTVEGEQQLVTDEIVCVQLGDSISYSAIVKQSMGIKKYNTKTAAWEDISLEDKETAVTAYEKVSGGSNITGIDPITDENLATEYYELTINVDGSEMETPFYLTVVEGKIFDKDWKIRNCHFFTQMNTEADDVLAFIAPSIQKSKINVPTGTSRILNINDYVNYCYVMHGDLNGVALSYYEDLFNIKWDVDGSVQSGDTCKVSSSANKVTLHVYFGDILIGTMTLEVNNGFDEPDEIIDYSPYIELGQTVKFNCIIDEMYEGDFIYSWWVDGEKVSDERSYSCKADSAHNKVVCIVTFGNNNEYKPQQEVTLGSTNVINKGTLKEDTTVNANKCLTEDSVDKYTFVPGQTGKYTVETDALDYRICDSDGIQIKSRLSGGNTYNLKANKKYYVYVDNGSDYKITIINNVDCDHSCGSKLINKSDTYTGDEVCINCEKLLKQGTVIKNDSKESDSTDSTVNKKSSDSDKNSKSGSKTDSQKTGDETPILLWVLITVIDIISIIIIAICISKRRKQKKTD